METNFVDVRKLYVQYGKFTAVKDLSFQIPRGAVFGFIGPNGAGKSSTLRVMATLLRPTTGDIRIGGVSVNTQPHEIRQKIGYLPDFFGVYEDLNVNEYLHFFAAAYQLSLSNRGQTINDVLELTDLSTKRDSRVDDLSRGMKQRLGLARLLLHDPELILLDEPASGLDPRARIEMRELLKELQKMGKTIVISSHILSELGELCTRIGIIEQGGLVAEGSLQDIYAKLAISRIIHMRISNLTEEMMKAISDIDGVENVSEDVDRISLEISEQKISIEDIHTKIFELNAKVSMFQPEAMDMESAFMKLTQGRVQ